MVIKFNKTLDVCNFLCPLPILKTKKILATMTSGQILRVILTDKSSINDFQIFTKQTGNFLLLQLEENSKFTLFIKRK